MQLSTQAKGLLITTVGVLVISPDTLLVRLLEIDRWAMLVYRGSIIALGLTLITYLLHGRSTLQRFRSIGREGLGISLLFAVSTTSFVTSLYFTSVANTLIIISSSAMFAALLSRIFLKEKIRIRTMVTMVVVTGSIGYIVADGLGGWIIQRRYPGYYFIYGHGRGLYPYPASPCKGYGARHSHKWTADGHFRLLPG